MAGGLQPAVLVAQGPDPVGEEIDEGPHLGRQVAVVGIDGIDPERLQRIVGQRGNQAAGADIVTDHEMGQARHTDAGQRRFALDRAVVGAGCCRKHGRL